MKIELEEKDINYINKVNEDISNGELPPLFVNEVGRNYFINFTCLDRAKANAFILNFCAPSMNKEVEEKFGIRINSINYCNGDNKITTLKEYLRSFLNTLENI